MVFSLTLRMQVKVAALEALIDTRTYVSNATFRSKLLPRLCEMLETARACCGSAPSPTRSTPKKAAGGGAAAGAGSGSGPGSAAGSSPTAGASPFAGASQLMVLPLLQGGACDEEDSLDAVTHHLARGFGEILCTLVDAGDVQLDAPSIRCFLSFYTVRGGGQRGCACACVTVHSLAGVVRDSLTQALGHSAHASARRLCAFNLPGVAHALGASAYDHSIHPLVRRLAEDEHAAVRRTVAAGLHEVAQVIGPAATLASLREVYLNLSSDVAPVVSGCVAAAMPEWLLRFHQPDAEEAKQNAAVAAVLPTMIAAAKSPAVTGFWRRQIRVLAAWRLLPLLAPQRSASDDVVSVLQLYLDEGSAPVRRATVATMVWLMRFGATGALRQKMKHAVFTTCVPSLRRVLCCDVLCSALLCSHGLDFGTQPGTGKCCAVPPGGGASCFWTPAGRRVGCFPGRT